MTLSAAPRSGRIPTLAKYDVLDELGHGGMATVYRARDRRLGRDVAVKVIHPHLRDSREIAHRFAVEAKAVAKLRHPNIVEVFDVSDADEIDQYLVVELIRGTTLRKVLQTRGAMPPEVAATIALDLLSAVAQAHASGVVHRDIKPENVLIEHRAPVSLERGSEGSPERDRDLGADRVVVKLTDFGIAKLLDAQGVTSTGQVLGSPAHMAPEQIEGHEVDGRADVFGLGVLLYECMVGHLPFEGNNPAQVLRRVLDGQYPEAQREMPAVGSRWSAILDRSLAHLAVDRYGDAGTMRAAISVELGRVGVLSPRRELEAWFDDPKSFGERHRAHMVETLRALGDDARKHGRPLDAASDYNRALANAPDDPKLLRIVAGMHKAEARARMVRRGTRVLATSVVLGIAAYGAGKLVQVGGGPVPQPSASSPGSVLPPPLPPSAAIAASAPAAKPSLSSGASTPAAVVTARLVDRATAADASAGKLADRTVTVNLTPAMGVRLSVDGAGERPVQTGDQLTLSGKAHVLRFSCPVCSPVERPLPEGDKDEEIRVVVPIRPAVLVIDGPPDRHYELAEKPLLNLRAGANKVTIGGQFESVTVVQLETGTRTPVRLEAGQEAHAAF